MPSLSIKVGMLFPLTARAFRRGILAMLLLCPALAAPLEAQTAPRPGSLRVTVRDATDLPVANAVVTVVVVTVVIEAAPLTGAMPPGATERATTTSAGGQANIEGLPPGTYAVRVEAPGFEPLTVPGLAVRSGARTSRDITLKIAGFVDEVDVAPLDEDQQLMNAFTSQLSPEAIAALPEDPEELLLFLQQLAGGDADVRVDGFSGGQLPPGAQIQDVRIRYDASAGSAGDGPRVEIRTRPGGDRWRTDGSVSVRDERLNSRNAFSDERPSGQTRQYEWTLNGPVVKNRTGLSLSINGSDALEQQAVRAAASGGIFSSLVSQPTKRLGFTARLEHALTNSQTMRLEVQQSRDTATNQGIGEFDLPERGYERERTNGSIRASHRATPSRKLVNDIRLQFGWDSTESSSVSDATTIRVPDAFSSGGAQMSGGRRTHNVEIEEELEVTVGAAHQITAGATLEGGRYSGDELRNANGTFTFASLETFEAGRPTSFTQRLGDPRYGYSMYQFGWSVQDNYRLRRNLMINAGVRQDAQTHLRDWANFSPRLSVSWTPIPKRTTLRASYATSYQSFDASLYEQTLRVNGRQQSDLVISDPGYPDPFAGGVPQSARPPGIIRSRADIVMPSTRRVQLGLDHPLTSWARLRATFSGQTGHNLFRSLDANAPINGARPDGTVRNITQIESTARSLSKSLDLQLTLTYQPRRFNATLRYTLGDAFNETDGNLTLPPDSFNVAGEWGPSRPDVRHRFNMTATSDLPAGFRVNANLRAQSASPYAVTTGFDSNGDGANNERPAGVGRNAGRGAATQNLDVTLTWGIGIGHRVQVQPPARGGRAPANGQRGNEVFRFEIYARGTNILNIVNPQSFSGVMTSPFFGEPTSASAARRVVIGTRIRF